MLPAQQFSSKVTGVVSSDAGVAVSVAPAAGGDTETMNADVVLVAIGRRPASAGLGLDVAGVATDKAGRIIVDRHTFGTNVPGVYAIGDLIAGPMLAHKAEEDGVACVETMAGLAGHVNYDTIPSIIYTHPEVAWVGKTEEEVKAAGTPYKTGKFPFMANSRARTIEDADGLVKFIIHAETDAILGVHIVGNSAGEMIAECVLAMEYGGSAEDIARTCHGHPTLSEAVKEAAMAVSFGKAIVRACTLTRAPFSPCANFSFPAAALLMRAQDSAQAGRGTRVCRVVVSTRVCDPREPHFPSPSQRKTAANSKRHKPGSQRARERATSASGPPRACASASSYAALFALTSVITAQSDKASARAYRENGSRQRRRAARAASNVENPSKARGAPSPAQAHQISQPCQPRKAWTGSRRTPGASPGRRE